MSLVLRVARLPVPYTVLCERRFIRKSCSFPSCSVLRSVFNSDKLQQWHLAIKFAMWLEHGQFISLTYLKSFLDFDFSLRCFETVFSTPSIVGEDENLQWDYKFAIGFYSSITIDAYNWLAVMGGLTIIPEQYMCFAGSCYTTGACPPKNLTQCHDWAMIDVTAIQEGTCHDAPHRVPPSWKECSFMGCCTP